MKFYAALLAVLMVGIAVGQNDEKLTISPSHKPVPALESDMVWKDSPGTLPLTCKVNSSGEGFVCHVLIEKVDVPAIHHDFIPVTSYTECPGDYMWATRGDGKHLCQPPREYTCAEKSRILEHDESTPAKYWCRKPQP